MEEFNPQHESVIEFPEIANEIMEMVKVDQDMRKKARLSNFEYWDKSVDANNTDQMKEILKQIGWPTISKVGEDASNGAWLLVQHADRDVAFQKYCLDLLKQEPEHEVHPQDIAHLTDRVCVNSHIPQIYGTQYTKDEHGNFVPREIENLEEVDERRKAMGLDTLKENIERMHEKYKVEKKEDTQEM